MIKQGGNTINQQQGQDYTNGLLIGRNAVREAISAGRPINHVYIRRGDLSGSLKALVAQAKDAGAVIKDVDSRKLDHMCGHANHQGIIAVAAEKTFAALDDIFQRATDRGEPPFIILCDEMEDPYNFGAIIRTAECCGAHGVIIPKRRSVGLTFAVGKASAGAIEYIPVARVVNLAQTIDILKEKGLWVYAADLDGQNWRSQDYTGPTALIIGAEGKGVSRLVKEKADVTVTLPLRGHIDSLNASVAAGILCYEVLSQRL